ncbi:Peroxisome size and maintenance regulator [Metarhizium acridum]|nr:Peroxisome size and maintenance regulator [Metarhizium acridum]
MAAELQAWPTSTAAEPPHTAATKLLHQASGVMTRIGTSAQLPCSPMDDFTTEIIASAEGATGTKDSLQPSQRQDEKYQQQQPQQQGQKKDGED